MTLMVKPGMTVRGFRHCRPRPAISSAMFLAPFSGQASHIFLEAGGEIGRSAEAHPVADFGDAVAPVFQQPARLLEPYLADEIKG